MGYYLICIALAFISYLWVPLLLILFKIPLSRKRRLIAIIANCLIVVLLFNLHHLVTDFQPVNYTAALLYGCIGYLMLNKWGTPEDEARNIKKFLYFFSLITGFYFVFSAIFIAYCGFTGYYDLGYSYYHFLSDINIIYKCLLVNKKTLNLCAQSVDKLAKR